MLQDGGVISSLTVMSAEVGELLCYMMFVSVKREDVEVTATQTFSGCKEEVKQTKTCQSNSSTVLEDNSSLSGSDTQCEGGLRSHMPTSSGLFTAVLLQMQPAPVS